MVRVVQLHPGQLFFVNQMDMSLTKATTVINMNVYINYINVHKTVLNHNNNSLSSFAQPPADVSLPFLMRIPIPSHVFVSQGDDDDCY